MNNFNIKRFGNIVALITIMAFFAPSCKKDFLESRPTGQLLDEQMTTTRGVQEALVSAYADLTGSYDPNGIFNALFAQPTNWLYGSVRGGDAHKGSTPGDQTDALSLARMETLPSNSYIVAKWIWLYDGIARSNNVLKLLKRVDLDQNTATGIEAEARFLRAYYAFEARKNFNKVPWIDETVSYSEGNYQVPNDQDIYSRIETDFKFAYDNLPTTQPDVGRVNKWAAGAFLAKVYLFQQKYQDAQPLLTDIIDNGQTSNGLKYDLQDQFDWNFRGAHQNSAESVFAIQNSLFDGSGGGHGRNGDLLNYPSASVVSSCCGFFQPSIELSNAFRTSNQGLPLLGGTYEAPEYDQPTNALKTDMNIQSTDPFTPDQGNLDPRLDRTVGRRGIPYMDWLVMTGRVMLKDQSSAGPYLPRKNVYLKSEIGQYADNGSTAGLPLSAINYNVIRFAQILLWGAECEVEAGNLDKAQEYVNRVRRRASNPNDFVRDANGNPAANYLINEYPAGYFNTLGQEKARMAVRLEERLELAEEGHRFYDLVRWGIVSEVMAHFFSYEGGITGDINGAKFTPNQNEYLPIPQSQIDLSNNTLTQNQGY